MPIQSERDYEDLLALWSDLESGLGIVLSSPESTQELPRRIVQYDRWMQSLLQRDPDVGLYLLFQLAANSPVGYSAAHSLICAVLTHLIGVELGLDAGQRDSLVRAALTMNIAMTAVQDELAGQTEKPSALQLEIIRSHAANGAILLAQAGVTDADWLDTVVAHHDEPGTTPQRQGAGVSDVGARLARILRTVDRYAAMISPRSSRSGRTATDSVRSILAQSTTLTEGVGQALVRAVGLYPPGTYVHLDDGALAVVVHRSRQHDKPFSVILSKPDGETLTAMRLHPTERAPGIRAALAASSVRARLNHFLVLQLGASIAPA